MSKLLVFTFVVVALILSFSVTAGADGPSSCTYSGSVRLDNAEVADGTLITAVIAGDEYHTHTSTGYGYSTYSLTILAPEGTNYPDGTKVTFKVNGHPTGQTADFQSGANVRLDLTAFTAPTLTPSRIALISGLVVVFLAAGVAAYSFLLRRRGIRIVDSLRGKGGVPSRQAPPLSFEGQGQPASRYIWDSIKLAWVPNIEPAKSKSGKKGHNTSIKVDARKKAAAPEQAVPASAKSQEQPLSRYIWDSAKLAWVENTEPVKIKPQIEPSETSTTRPNIPVAAIAGTTQQMRKDTSIPVASQSEAAGQKELVAMTGKGAAEFYRGNIKLLVTSPSGLGQMNNFSTYLRGLTRSHMIRILNMSIESQQSVGFELYLEKPVLFLNVLKGMPEVDTIEMGLEHSLVEVKLKA